MMKYILSGLLFCFMLKASSQEVNQRDEKGKRDGKWQKSFEENPDQIRYSGTFEHGEEVGLFKFYILGQKTPAATKLFSANSDIAEAKFYAQNGKLISEGKMKGEQRIASWTYYHKNSEKVMLEEQYENGILEGEKNTYFPNGQLAKKSFYQHGELNGNQIIYSEKGMVLKKYHYKNDELNGPAEVYNGKGELLVEGSYKNNKHTGVWKYYEDGKLKEKRKFDSKK